MWLPVAVAGRQQMLIFGVSAQIHRVLPPP